MTFNKMTLFCANFSFFALSILVVFNGVNFNEVFSLPPGSVGLFLTSLLFVLLLSNLYLNKYSLGFYKKSTYFLSVLFLLAIVGYGTTRVSDSSVLSFVLNYGLFALIISSKLPSIRLSFFENTLLFLVALNIIAFFLYGLYFFSGFQISPKITKGLFDSLLRFSGTFSEPSYLGFFSLILMFYYLNKNKFISLVCFILLVFSQSKIVILIVPIIFLLYLKRMFTGVLLSRNNLFFIFMFSIVVLIISSLGKGYVFEAIGEYIGYYSNRTFTTRFFFPLYALEHAFYYPLGTGLLGFKSSLLPQLIDFTREHPLLDTLELSGYTSTVNNTNFNPKDVYSLFVFSAGYIGFFVYFYMWWIIFFRFCKNDKSRVIALIGYLSSFLSIQINILWFFCLLIVIFSSREIVNENRY